MTTYNITPQHYKTLDIVGKSKSFSKLTLKELINYFQYIQHIEIDCKDNKLLSIEYLTKRYAWNNIDSRLKDLDKAWETLKEQIEIECINKIKPEEHSIHIDDDNEELNISLQSNNNNINTTIIDDFEDKDTSIIINENNNIDIPILFKSSSLHKSMVLCQLDDENLQFQGISSIDYVYIYLILLFI